MGILRQLQDQQKVWVKHNFGDRPAWQPLLGAVEEIGELAHAHLKHAQNIRVSESHIENAKDAVADTIIYLADYCSAMGFDLETLVVETWNQVKQRDWKKYPSTGLPEATENELPPKKERQWKCTQCGNIFGTDDVYTSTGAFYHWNRSNYDCGPVVEEEI